MLPPDFGPALAKFREFHDQAPHRLIPISFAMPAHLEMLEPLRQLIYRSSKWDTISLYEHTFTSNVGTYKGAPNGKTEAPEWLRSTKSLVRLGDVDGTPLYCTPYGRALIIGTKNPLILFGGDLQVTTRGIIG